jgi:hypothetical protein
MLKFCLGVGRNLEGGVNSKENGRISSFIFNELYIKTLGVNLVLIAGVGNQYCKIGGGPHGWRDG